MLTTIELKLTSGHDLKACAWFLPGSDPAMWLQEVSRWSSETHRFKFYFICSPGSDETAGAFVVFQGDFAPPPGSRGQPYGEIIRGFYIPVNAILSPPVDQAEIKALCLHETMIFHPVYGLSGFGDADAHSAADLIEPPPRRLENWNAARAPARPNHRLRSVRLETPLTLSEVFGEESREIGSEPITDLPPAPTESGYKLPERIAEGVSSLFVRGVLGMASLVPRSAHISPTWINHLEMWAQGKLSGITEELERRRHKELHRLLELLEKNPEEGLRHAISLAQLAHRGKAPPSDQLGNRSLNFVLSRLGGGRPTDAWSIPSSIQSTLAQRYRDNAQRELKLGRHRRAAYIYAELLGDFASAADTLKQGKFFREAALLYQERLYKPLLAAECLAGGGLFEEAIEIYEKHAQWLEVADLYEKSGHQDRANTALRSAVDAHLKSGDVIAAAHLIETRLHAADEALALLASAWPAGKQALRCLEERLALLARLHRSNDLRTTIIRLGQESTPVQHTTDLIGLLARTAEHAAGTEVRQAATEVVRIKASAVLSDGTLERAGEISVLRALTRLDPHDRLLSRDVNRFREKRRSTPAPRLPPPRPNLIRRLTLKKTTSLQLPQVGVWSQVEGYAHGFNAVARRQGARIFFIRSTWQGAEQNAEWPDPGPPMESLFLLKSAQSIIVLGRPFNKGLTMISLPGTYVFKQVASSVGTPEWLPEDTLQVAESGGTLWAVRVVNNRVVLASFHSAKLVHSQDVTDEFIAASSENGGTQLQLDAGGARNCVALGYGNCLLVLRDQSVLELRKFDYRITGLLPGHPSLPGWIVVLERGAEFVSADKLDRNTLDDSMMNPRATCLLDGRLILLGPDEGKVFQRNAGRWSPSGWFPSPGETQSAIAITCTDVPHELALFQSSGEIQRWEVPV